jgi:hypothetical protein
MEEVGCVFIFIWMIVSTVLAGVFIADGITGATLKRDCEAHGYYNVGQVRILCAVEPRK